MSYLAEARSPPPVQAEMASVQECLLHILFQDTSSSLQPPATSASLSGLPAASSSSRVRGRHPAGVFLGDWCDNGFLFPQLRLAMRQQAGADRDRANLHDDKALLRIYAIVGKVGI